MIISSHRHTKSITIYRATIYGNDLRISREDFLQLKTQRRNQNKMSRRGRNVSQPELIVLSG